MGVRWIALSIDGNVNSSLNIGMCGTTGGRLSLEPLSQSQVKSKSTQVVGAMPSVPLGSKKIVNGRERKTTSTDMERNR
jgi:hypothetical protein